MTEVAVIAGAYLLGSVPTGVLVGSIAGIDVRRVGSRNIGATNVTRATGRLGGLVTLIGDVGKGIAAIAFARTLTTDPTLVDAAALAVVVGHVWSIFLRFSGGKGVATGFGVCMAIAPVAAALPLAVFAAVLALTRIVSVASLAGVFTMPIGLTLAGMPPMSVAVSAMLAIVVSIRHRDNIRRLLAGAEPRLGSGRHRAGGSV